MDNLEFYAISLLIAGLSVMFFAASARKFRSKRSTAYLFAAELLLIIGGYIVDGWLYRVLLLLGVSALVIFFLILRIKTWQSRSERSYVSEREMSRYQGYVSLLKRWSIRGLVTILMAVPFWLLMDYLKPSDPGWTRSFFWLFVCCFAWIALSKSLLDYCVVKERRTQGKEDAQKAGIIWLSCAAVIMLILAFNPINKSWYMFPLLFSPVLLVSLLQWFDFYHNREKSMPSNVSLEMLATSKKLFIRWHIRFFIIILVMVIIKLIVFRN